MQNNETVLHLSFEDHIKEYKSTKLKDMVMVVIINNTNTMSGSLFLYINDYQQY